MLEPGSYTGVNKENESAGSWNLMRKAQPAMHIDKVPGKVTSADVVMNFIPGRGRGTQAAMSKFPESIVVMGMQLDMWVM